jgi:hypothetical protein
MDKPPVWMMVREAVESLGGMSGYRDIKKFIKDKYGPVNDTIVALQIIRCCVNLPSRIQYVENKKPRVATTRYDCLYSIGDGRVELYDPKKHGTWEISAQPDGKLVVQQHS